MYANFIQYNVLLIQLVIGIHIEDEEPMMNTILDRQRDAAFFTDIHTSVFQEE